MTVLELLVKYNTCVEEIPVPFEIVCNDDGFEITINGTIEIKKNNFMSLGRFLRQHYGKYLTLGLITHVCEYFNSLTTVDNKDFKIVSGNDIYKYYYWGNYHDVTGSLGSSCMRHIEKQPFFKLYVDHAKMLVLFSNDDSGRIMGRAILWPYGDVFLVDRIYTTDRSYEYAFKTYAMRNNFLIRATNNAIQSGHIVLWLTPKDNYKQPQLIDYCIKLDKTYSSYPYVDSVCYISTNKRYLSTIPYKGGLILHSTEGYITYC